MRFMYYFLSIFTGKYKFRVYDFFVDDKKNVVFVITPITRFAPETILLENLVKNQKILSRLDPDSLRIFKKVLNQVEQSVSTRVV
jgi:hypothetical protein